MRKCPFCGAEINLVFPYFTKLENGKWCLIHHCNEHICVVISAETKEEVITKWNGEGDV